MVQRPGAGQQQGLTSIHASETLGLPRSTLYRWQRELINHGPGALEPKSRKPRRHRQPTWSPELADAVLGLREQYPRWGKDKLVILLRREGLQVSTSLVERILTRLKARGVLKEPPRKGISARKRLRPRPYAVRKPKEYQALEPGDIVQIDTLDVRPLPDTVLKHFTARDVISRWDVLEVHTRATSALAAGFLNSIRQRLPFPLKAVQVDVGSEFQAAFEQACQELGIKLFVLPPRSPKLNGHVERAQRTHTEEFYELYDGDLEIAPLNQAFLAWEHIYNTARPRRSLDGRTPNGYLQLCHPDPFLDHLSLM
ncbi:MAG: integrase core domain-containing protein [Dehalococcoidia bacterium]|nr:integrase core domain-containing protein [Dehalococcoidia bacterium]